MPKYTVALEIPISAMEEVEIEAESEEEAKKIAVERAKAREYDFIELSEIRFEDVEAAVALPLDEEE